VLRDIVLVVAVVVSMVVVVVVIVVSAVIIVVMAFTMRVMSATVVTVVAASHLIPLRVVSDTLAIVIVLMIGVSGTGDARSSSWKSGSTG
jgi:hypothetical protein